MQAVDAGKYGVPSRRDPDKLISRLFRINPVQWQQLKNKFKTLKTISEQPPSALTFVHGISTKRSEFIINFLNEKIE
jgi:DNA integrity scanning protein DisA with diadenylate cyclase activity